MNGKAEKERRALEEKIREGDLDAVLDLAALALEHVSDDDEEALLAAAKLVKDAIARFEKDEERLLQAWDLAPESFIAWPKAWDEKETLTLAERDLGREDPLVFLLRGLFAFHRADWKGAERLLREVEEDALAAHWLGCALERLGRDREADRELERAARLDPERFSPPIRMSDEEFRACVEEARAQLPAEIREAVESRSALVVEDFPADAAVRQGTDPLSLGLFAGSNVSEQETGAEEVVLYKKNLEKIAPSRGELVEEIQITLFHEIGHALGFEEEGVDDLGLA